MTRGARLADIPQEDVDAGSIRQFTWSGAVRMMRLAATRHPLLAEAGIAFLVLSLVFWSRCGQYLLGPHTVSAWGDNTHWLQPLFCAIDRIAAAGERPYWLETLSGVREYTDPQLSITYPFYFFGMGWYKTPLATSVIMHRVAFLHLFFLCCNTYIMLRVFGIRWIPAVVGEAVVAFSTNSYIYMVWIQIIAPYSWLPLALAAVHLILDDRHPLAGFFLGVIAIPMLVLASPAHPLIHLVYLTAVLVVFATIVKLRSGAPLLRPWCNLALLALVSFALAAPGLIPPLLELPNSIRWIGAAPPVLGNAPIPYEHFSIGEALVRDLAHVLFSYRLEQLVGDSFVGTLPVFLACFSIFVIRRNRIVTPVLLLGVYALLSSSGTHLGLSFINYHLPLLNKSREPARHLFVWVLACGTLAAFGFEYLTDLANQSKLWHRRTPHFIVLGLFLVGLFVAYQVRAGRSCEVPTWVAFGSLGVFAAALILANRFPAGKTPAFQFALAATVIAANLAVPARTALLGPPATSLTLKPAKPSWHLPVTDYYWDPNPRTHSVLARLAQLEDINDFRVLYHDDKFSPTWWAMNGCFYGVRSFHNWINPQSLILHMDMQLPLANDRVARLWGAKYLVTSASDATLLPDYKPFNDVAGYMIRKNAKACPRCYLVNEIAGTYDSRAGFVAAVNSGGDLIAGLYAPDKEASLLKSWFRSEKGGLAGQVTQRERTANHSRYVAESNGATVLVFNEFYHRDWQVRLDGKRVDAIPVNWNRIGVLVPNGQHEVSFDYRPRLFGWLLQFQRGTAVIVTLAGAVLLLFRRESSV